MRIFLGLISSNEEICRIFRTKQNQLIPQSVLKHQKLQAINPIFSFGTFNPTADRHTLESYLLHATRNSEAGILLVENCHEAIIKNVRHSFFTAIIDFPSGWINCQNFFGQIYPQLLKNFADLVGVMNQANNQKVMALPIRNFKSNELCELVRICEEETMQSTFANSIGVQISGLKKRKQPRRDTTSQRQYLVDDDDKYFEYGTEHHAILATGAPHTPSCEIAGNFRFGKKIPSNEHYNMQRLAPGGQTKISGIFLNCHDDKISTSKEVSHINIFSNDYH